MTVPVLWTDLSETAASNPPPPTGENVGHNLPLYFQALYAFIRMAYDGQFDFATSLSANTQQINELADGTVSTDVATIEQLIAAWNAPSGTRVLLHQAAAPTGWTVDSSASFTDCAVRLNAATAGTETAGATGWTGWGTSATSYNDAGTSLLDNHIAQHTHGFNVKFGPYNPPGDGIPGLINVQPQVWNYNQATGLGTGISGSPHVHAITPPNMKYADLIIGIKS